MCIWPEEVDSKMASLNLYFGNSIHACRHAFIHVCTCDGVCTWMYVSERVRACARLNCQGRARGHKFLHLKIQVPVSINI